ncbi:MAG: threonine synthase [Peptostreptococcaceae bacterium]|nr:threonine synthase [Peptostreptococcaceae bacterium]
MQLYYKSSRGADGRFTASEAIIRGIAEDGGLFVPNALPKFEMDYGKLKNKTYRETAYDVMSLFLDDFSEEELRGCIAKAYDNKFDTEAIAPLVRLDEKVSVLELFHGPTLAFKDMALSILPRFMQIARSKNNIEENIVILTATSGDTGKAALEGFADVEGVEIIVFFPVEGVSSVQKLQMVTQEGANTHVAGIIGNFDDAQTGVKRIFGDKEYAMDLKKKGYGLSSANSINIGRLVPQIVYYFYAYGQLMEQGTINEGEFVDFVVPTGNFGNILAGYYAKKMGLPVRHLVCASNENKVLADFFGSGTYDRNRSLKKTQSPSMDILVSSNLERLLYEASGTRKELVSEWMKSLEESGAYDTSVIFENLKGAFEAGWISDAEGSRLIEQVYRKYGYLMDTHTAVAYGVNEKRKGNDGKVHSVILSTASPYKFPKSVLSAIDGRFKDADEIDLLEKMSEYLKGEVPAAVKGIRDRKVMHNHICDKDGMKEAIDSFLEGRDSE